MSTVITLPAWASFRMPAKGKKTPIKNGESLLIDVNGPEMYEALFDELRERYKERVPDAWLEEGKLKKEWKDALEDDLFTDTPSAYWCEVAYQMMKLELQSACRTFALNITVHDLTKGHRQVDRPQKRSVARAASGVRGGREARQHFKNLRGFFPS